jgi:hypothetical protein
MSLLLSKSRVLVGGLQVGTLPLLLLDTCNIFTNSFSIE